MLRDVEATLTLAAEQIAEIEAMYRDSLAKQEIPGRLQALIKGVIEHQRSALDFVANEVAITHGTAKDGDRIYWPYATTPTRFDEFFDKNLPGVRAKRPALVEAWRKYQPYTPGCEWIADLIELAKGNKHRRLAPQVRKTHRATKWQSPGGGASITLGEGASIQMGSGADIRLGGVSIREIQPQQLVYVDWRFADIDKSALHTLVAIQAGIVPVLQDLCDLADL
jgi:hypothetical protein